MQIAHIQKHTIIIICANYTITNVKITVISSGIIKPQKLVSTTVHIMLSQQEKLVYSVNLP
jgi:hypothetical protein